MKLQKGDIILTKTAFHERGFIMSKDFLDWLGYYKKMNEGQFLALPKSEREVILENYNKDVSYGWQEMKEQLI